MSAGDGSYDRQAQAEAPAGPADPIAAEPALALSGGVLATVVIGGVAGLYPAVGAARLSPTEALSTP